MSNIPAEAQIKAEIKNTDFLNLLSKNTHEDPSTNLKILTSVLVNAKNKHCGPKRVRFNRYKHKINPWMTFGLIKSIKRRDSLYKRFHSLSPDSEEFLTCATNLKTYSRILNSSIRLAKRCFYSNLLNNCKNKS